MSEHECITHSAGVAYEWIMQGRILAYPTESVWGLGCHAFDVQAVNKLLALKQRPAEKGVIVLTSDESYIDVFLKNLPKTRQDDVIKSWACANDRRQASTWLFDIPDGVSIPPCVRGKHESLAIRVINHAKIAKLCDLLATHDNNPFGFLMSTSCNVGGQVPARDFETAWRYFGDKVCYLLSDTLGYDKPSQIIHAITGQVVR